MSVIRALWERFRHLVAELAKFGTVGALCAVVDIGLTNVLRYAVGWGPLTSKTIAVVVAASLAFLGNRFWTFRHRANQGLAKEYFLYFVLNGIGLLIALLVTGFTVYILKLDNPIAYNLSANVIGLGLGTLFRFWSYRKWVFLPTDVPPVDPLTGLPESQDDQPAAPPGAVDRGITTYPLPGGSMNGAPLDDGSTTAPHRNEPPGKREPASSPGASPNGHRGDGAHPTR